MSDNQTNINVAELNQAAAENVIFYQPQRIDYAISDGELNQLQNLGKSNAKEFFFASVGIFIPTLINAIVAYEKIDPGKPEIWEFALNMIATGITGILAIFFVIIWRKEAKQAKDIIAEIKSKPKFKVPLGIQSGNTST